MRYHLRDGELLYVTDDSVSSESFTTEPPPEVGPRQSVRYVEGTWVVMADWRHVPLYDTATGQAARILSLGATPEDVGYTELKPPPDYVWSGSEWAPPTSAQYDAAFRLKALAELDAAADECRLQVAGNPLRIVEYQRAADEAAHFQATGEALPAVTSWAAAKGWSNAQAAQSILDEARAWNGVLYAIRDIRLEAKESIRTAPLDQVTSIKESAKVTLRNLIIGVGNAATT